jgi:hypothetical protein
VLRFRHFNHQDKHCAKPINKLPTHVLPEKTRNSTESSNRDEKNSNFQQRNSRAIPLNGISQAFLTQSHQRHSYRTFRAGRSTATWTEVSKPSSIWRHIKTLARIQSKTRVHKFSKKKKKKKKKEPSPNFKRQNGDVKQRPYWGPTFLYVKKITATIMLKIFGAPVERSGETPSSSPQYRRVWHSSVLYMEVGGSSETLVPIYQTKWREALDHNTDNYSFRFSKHISILLTILFCSCKYL